MPSFANLCSRRRRHGLCWRQYGWLHCGRSLRLMLRLYQACVTCQLDSSHAVGQGSFPAEVLPGMLGLRWLLCPCNTSISLWASSSQCQLPYCCQSCGTQRCQMIGC